VFDRKEEKEGIQWNNNSNSNSNNNNNNNDNNNNKKEKKKLHASDQLNKEIGHTRKI
jgi:hypothetical protein